MGRQVALGVVALVRVGSTPLETRGGQLVGCQRAGARRKTGIILFTNIEKMAALDEPAGDDDGLLSIPGAVLGHHVGVCADILGGNGGQARN